MGISVSILAATLALQPAGAPPPGEGRLDLPLDTWVELSPAGGAPASPGLGYEGACAWDPVHRQLIRYGGHNQGGGGEQGSEVWTFEPLSRRWTLHEPDTSPPGVCCAQQDLYDPVRGRFLRFPAFTLSHGWQWPREEWLNEASVWDYDPAARVWRCLRPLPAPDLRPLRCASWDPDRRIAVLFGGEGGRDGTVAYDPHSNEWTRLRPPSEPEPRSGGNMAYDPVTRRHVLFGSQFSDDRRTWAYDLSANRWIDLQPSLLPPTDRNDAVLASDLSSGLVLALVKVTTGKEDAETHRLETWTFRGAESRWTRLALPAEPTPSGSRCRVLVHAPELDCFLLEDCTHPPQGPREQQVWAFRPSPPTGPAPVPSRADAPGAQAPGGPASWARPPIVEDVVVSVGGVRRVEVSWKPTAAEVSGYQVERAPVEVLTEDQLRRLKTRTPPLAEASAGALTKIGKFVRLTQAPVKEPVWIDPAVDLSVPAPVDGEPLWEHRFHDEDLDRSGKPYRFAVFAYRVRAVGAAGLESGPSPAVFTIPSAPRSLFSKEEGTTCRLRWAPGPEKGLRGYRVYRMDGRYDSESISRLMPEPLPAVGFADPDAGKSTRRYYVAAVDALGQEGHPSSPVWFEREWKKRYLPFTGEWHQ